jgi:hypothetical protein
MSCKKFFKNDCCCDKCKKKKDHKEFHCKVNKKLLKECICCEWTVPKGETQTVFQTAGFEKIIGSGFVSFDDGQVPFILVTFFEDGYQVGETIKVFNDSCVAFTYTKFDSIKVSCPNLNNSHPDQQHGCEGEICITTRFPV